MRSPQLLLVSPAFHGYHRSIAKGFATLGYDVDTYCYDLYDSWKRKIRNKAALELPEKFGVSRVDARERWDTERAVAALREHRPDRLIVIKGDSLGEAFWAEVSAMKVPVILWLYDDLVRHSFTMDFLKEIGPVLSYAASERDDLAAAGVNAHFIPNAFDPDLAQPSANRTGEIVFVGARYPNRSEILERLVNDGVPVRAYGRQWSRHYFDRIRTWEMRRPNVPAERDIPLYEAYHLQGEAAGAINIHGLQAGLSMRTFEIPGMGGVQLIDRDDVAQFYDPGTEVLTYSTYDELRDAAERLIANPRWAEGIRSAGRKRTLAEHTFAHRAADIDRLWSL